jgi:hypothetical protein
MKAKLIKNHYGFDYFLADKNGSAIATSDNGKLSLKNCQAIERGYDLNELADELAFKHNDRFTLALFALRRGMELVGDKKFSEMNMEDAYYFGSKKLREEYLDFIKTFQQTEWDVEIVEFTADDLKSASDDWAKLGQPKLDADGCLILKRVV